jgi:hypothetical protein
VTDTYTVATWTEAPYTSYDKRHIRVEHRVRLLVYDEDHVDVVHERRQDDDGQRGEWKGVDVLEVRPHGVREQSLREGVMAE